MSRKQATPTQRTSWAPLIMTALVLGCALLVWLAWLIAHLLTGTDPGAALGPVSVLLGLPIGRMHWSVTATITLVVLVAVVYAAMLAMLRRRARPTASTGNAGRKEPIDDNAQFMASPREMKGVTAADAKAKAARLWPGRDDRDPYQWGIPIGTMIAGNTPLYMSWEDVAVVIAGQRAGKTAGLAIDAVVGAPGASLVTANKRDLLDATRGPRAARGRVWINDLQLVARPVPGVDDTRERGWWWNPLRGVTTISEAKKVAENFISATKPENSTVDSYFDGGAGDVLAITMLAAALGGGDMLHVYGWVNQPDTTLPEQLLRRHGDEFNAVRLASFRKLNPRQRDGLYDMARRFIGVLADKIYAASITPPERTVFRVEGHEDSDMGAIRGWGGPREEFLPERFVASCDTLYLLSEDDAGSAAPLTTALAGKVFEAARVRARQSPGGRMPVPMVAVLDEAANVCKLAHLPGWYSHFGSQGIVLITILQSKEQGSRVWGASGINTMVETANLHYYGGSVKSTDYLRDWSTLIGKREVSRWSKSTNTSTGWFTGHTQSQSWSKEEILDESDLAAIPETRALAHFSKNYPVLIRKAFWNQGPHKEAIDASIATYGPSAAEDRPAGASGTAEDTATGGGEVAVHPARITNTVPDSYQPVFTDEPKAS
ncbi:MAG: type IV secretory system conjugative DNA transfer family protein [Gordonia polyisoprenivorans]|nr:type IV secretory system conjugative DNA transfer family protein [Gordonia polyisoprenivorans]